MSDGATSRSPFLDANSFAAQERVRIETETSLGSSSPFLTVHEFGDQADPLAGEHLAFLSELYDSEFDEAVLELAGEAAALHDATAAEGEVTADGHRMLESHFEPLAREAEGMLSALGEKYGQVPLAGVPESELETFLDVYHPSHELSPAFENFFKSIRRAVKKVAKKAVGLAKRGVAAAAKLGLGPILNKLKALIRPLLDRVLKMAIRKLPEKLQPLASKLAQRLGLQKEMEEETAGPEEEREADLSAIQHEFHREAAELLFASSEVEQELEVARVAAESRAPFDNPVAELDRARARFMDELSRLKEGEDPAPLVEGFLPALLPALKLGIRIAGRKRVVRELSRLLARLIRGFVGPQNASALSMAIVDAGLKLMSLETEPGDEARAAAGAVAATVEETVRRVSALPDYVLDNGELLEGFALEAFEQAAAANLPPVLSEETYQQRPDLREAASVRGAWVMRPLRGRQRYKKFSRVLRARITPHKAAAVKASQGAPLDQFLEEQLGLAPGAEVEAEMHLFETIPGTMLPEVAHLERETPGLGSSARPAWQQFHPLTPEAAGMLLGEPALGRENSEALFDGEAGRRFYYLSIPGRRPPLGAGEPNALRRPTHLQVTLDFPADRIVASLYMSEVRAQRMAVRLRRREQAGAVLASLRAILGRGLRAVFGAPARARIKIVHEAVAPARGPGDALQRLPSFVPRLLRGRLQEWLLKGLADQVTAQAQQFVAATEAPADGVTLTLTVKSPPGFAALRDALRGRVPSAGSLKFAGPPPAVEVAIAPGYTHA